MAAFALALATGWVVPAAAEEQPAPVPEAGDLALEGVGKLMRALELFMQSIPAYGQPYIDEDGNIVIPRLKDPDATPTLDPPVEDTGTTT
jgi:hypothetical protein